MTLREWLTRDLLLAVAHDGADDGVLLAGEAVHGALGVAFGLGGLVLGLALGVLLLARLGPGLGARQVANGLDGGAFERAELAIDLATHTSDVSNEFGHLEVDERGRGSRTGRKWCSLRLAAVGGHDGRRVGVEEG